MVGQNASQRSDIAGICCICNSTNHNWASAWMEWHGMGSCQRWHSNIYYCGHWITD